MTTPPHFRLAAQFKAGEAVPSWLIDATPMEVDSVRGSITFEQPCAIVETPDRYIVVPSDVKPKIMEVKGAIGCQIGAVDKTVSINTQWNTLWPRGKSGGAPTQSALANHDAARSDEDQKIEPPVRKGVVIKNSVGSVFDLQVEGFDIGVEAEGVVGGSMKAVVREAAPPEEIAAAYRKLVAAGAPPQVAAEKSGLAVWIREHLVEVAGLIASLVGLAK